MTNTNTTEPERPDKNHEPKNRIFEVVKQKTIEFIRIATPIAQAGLKAAIRGIRHGITVGKERFMQLDQRQQIASVTGVLILSLFGGWWLLTPGANGQDKTTNSVQSEQSVVDEAAKAQEEIAKFCDEYGTDVKAVDRNGRTLLHKAVGSTSIHVIKYLVEKGADVNAESELLGTPFEYAVLRNGNIDVLKCLLENGAEINGVYGIKSPLEKLFVNPDVSLELVKFLVENGAEINTPDEPFRMAVSQCKNAEVIKYLVEQGADMRPNNEDNITSLHSAARCNTNVEIIRCLVELGAEINAENVFGETPLHEAAANNENIEVVKYLVDQGANLNTKNKKGATPYDVAKKAERNEIAQYLSTATNKPRAVQIDNYEKEKFNQLHKSAESGDAESQFKLGLCYQIGRHVEENETKALQWYFKASEQGYVRAKHKIRFIEKQWENTAILAKFDKEEFSKIVEHATKGHAIAIEILKDIDKGLATSIQQRHIAVNANAKPTEQDDAETLFNRGLDYFNGEGVVQNRPEGVKLFRKAAEQGHTKAQCLLGKCYLEGLCVTKDYSEAVRLFRKAAEKEDAESQGELGVSYFEGRGVTQDYTEAVKWFSKAAEQDHAVAQHNLGKCFFLGNGVPKNRAEAAILYRKSAVQGHAPAQCDLGACYLAGQGVIENPTIGVQWLHKSAAQGDSNAQFLIGVCCEHGMGTTRDLSEAMKWYRKAADQGNAKAIERLR